MFSIEQHRVICPKSRARRVCAERRWQIIPFADEGGAKAFKNSALEVEEVAGFIRQVPLHGWRPTALVPTVESVGRAFSQCGTPSAFLFDHSLWSHISAISAIHWKVAEPIKSPGQIIGRGCVGSDIKLLCMHFCCRAESTPRHHHTVFLFRCGYKGPIFRVVGFWRENFRLASQPVEPHLSIMADMHPFTGEKHPFNFNVMADPLRELRYRWTVCEGVQIHMRSPNSYASRSEAEKEKLPRPYQGVWSTGGVENDQDSQASA